MPNLWVNIILIAALLAVGALVSLPVLLRPVRRWCCQRSLAARGLILCMLGLVSFVISFAGLTRLKAQVTYVFSTMTIVDTFRPAGARVVTPPEVNEPSVVRELWIRLLLHQRSAGLHGGGRRGFDQLGAMGMVSVLGGCWTGKYFGCSQQYPRVAVHAEKERHDFTAIPGGRMTKIERITTPYSYSSAVAVGDFIFVTCNRYHLKSVILSEAQNLIPAS